MAVLKYKDPVTGKVMTVGAPVTQPEIIPVILSTGNWAGEKAPYTYTLPNYKGKTVEVVEDINMTMEQLNAIENANIKSDPRNTENILYAFGMKPTIDVPVLLIVR